MYGLLIEGVCEFIKEKFGEKAWLKIRDKSRIHEYTFVTHRMYSEKIIPRLAQAVHDVTGYSKEQFMDETGVQFVQFLKKYDYDKMLRVLGRSLRDFLNGLDNLHEYLRFSYPKMKPPSFFCTDENLEGLTLHYRTRRAGYTHYVKGQLRQVAKQFYNRDVSVIVVEEKQSGKDSFYIKYRIKFDNREFAERTRLSMGMNGHAQLNANLFFEVFPFHVVFGKDMKIKNTGRGLKAVLPNLEDQVLGDAFEMKRPNLPLTWESIITHENNVFELASTTLISRDSITFGCPLVQPNQLDDGNPDSDGALPATLNDGDASIDNDGDSSDSELRRHGRSQASTTNVLLGIHEREGSGSRSGASTPPHEILEEVYHPRQIRLKGQMLCVPEWHSYIFLATPMLPDIQVMFQTGLYINDLSMHDSSRDLVLAGTQQSAELKLALDQEQRKSAQLEESMMKLDQEMKRTDSLLYQMIPRQVAEKLRRGEPATNTCEVFQSVTILFSDVVGFTSICSRIPPMAVVSMLNGMYTKFDNLSETYEVYKVETIGDAYMVVAGAPNVSKFHAVRISEMALSMVESVHDLKDPSSSTNESIKIRIGIHTGMVVAGVVGLKMPRYCLFGDSVNTASRMESTGEAMKIHMSETTRKNLDQWPDSYRLMERGSTVVKGKGAMKTYWLLGRNRKMGEVSPLDLALEEMGTSRSRASSCDSSPVMRRSIAGSRLAINEEGSRASSAQGRAYTPVITQLERALTPQPSKNALRPTGNAEKATPDPEKPIGGGHGAGDKTDRRESNASMFIGYVPVSPALGDGKPEIGVKTVCTCKKTIPVCSRGMQTDILTGSGTNNATDTNKVLQNFPGNGSNQNQKVTTANADANKTGANVAHSTACFIL